MKFSIIAPCRNERSYIGKFLRSIESQHYRSSQIEIIIVDGGSTDGSLEIIDEWKERAPFDVLVIEEHAHNIGYVRNLGARHSTGSILFHTNTDVIFNDSYLLEKVANFYEDDNIFALCGATHELDCSKRTRLAYEAYHLARWFFFNVPFPIKRYSPSANFLSIRRDVFNKLGGFPYKYVNEDGFFGREMLRYAEQTGRRMGFSMKMRVCHHPSRFNSMGWLRAMQYYFYVLPNIAPFLGNLLGNIHEQSAKAFKRRLYKKGV